MSRQPCEMETSLTLKQFQTGITVRVLNVLAENKNTLTYAFLYTNKNFKKS